MRPVTQWKRKIYFFVFSVVFVLLIPIVTLVASGYRMEGWKLVPTGGISLSHIPEGAEVYLDYRPAKSSILSRSFFVQNLVPREYFVVVAKKGYWSWAKHISVKEKQVGHASVLLLPQEPKLVPVLEFVPKENLVNNLPFFTATSTEQERNGDYDDLVSLFAEPLGKTKRGDEVGTEHDPIELGRVELWKKEGTLVARWNGGTNSLPSFFCNLSLCSQQFTVFENKSIKRFDFLPGRNDVVIALTESGLYALEIDQRREQTIQPVYLSQALDFRVDNETLYIKDGTRFFEVKFE